MAGDRRAGPRLLRSGLAGAGCRVQTFRPLSDWSVRRDNNRNHRRVLGVDGRLGLTGGSGVSEKWTGEAAATSTGGIPACASRAPR